MSQFGVYFHGDDNDVDVDVVSTGHGPHPVMPPAPTSDNDELNDDMDDDDGAEQLPISTLPTLLPISTLPSLTRRADDK